MKFKVGDMVTVRGWEEMEKEFGLAGENIKCAGLFTKYMKELCGKTAIVKECNEDMKYYTLRPMAVEDMELDWDWDFTDDMLEG